jgi:hypothetical protein
MMRKLRRFIFTAEMILSLLSVVCWLFVGGCCVRNCVKYGTPLINDLPKESQ